MDKSDVKFLYLYTLTTIIQTEHNKILDAIHLRQLRTHKHQVGDLIIAITKTIDIFPHWRSGKNRLRNLQRLRNALLIYFDIVLKDFDRVPQQNTLACFRHNIPEFEDYIRSILDQFV